MNVPPKYFWRQMLCFCRTGSFVVSHGLCFTLGLANLLLICSSCALCRKFTQQLCSNKHHVAPWQCLQQNITLVKRTVLHMNAQTVFVLLDDVVELVMSQQLPGVVFVTANCLHEGEPSSTEKRRQST